MTEPQEGVPDLTPLDRGPNPRVEKAAHRGAWSSWRRKRRLRDVEDIFSLRDNLDATMQLGDVESLVSRQRLSSLILRTYITLFVTGIIFPLIVFSIISWGEPTTFYEGLRDVQNYAVATAAALSPLVGLIGYVLGRFFGDRELS